MLRVVSSSLSIRSSWAGSPQVTFPVPRGTGLRCVTLCSPLGQHAGLCISVSSAQRPPKPTRFASNLPAAQAFGVHWHSLRDDGTYAGPLGQCPHSHDSHLIGFSDGWRTAAAAAYPPELCKYLAF